MVSATKVNYVMVLSMAKALTSMSTETNTRENGVQIEKTVMVCMITTALKRNMMDNGWMERSTGMEFITTLMVIDMKEIGKKVKKMEKES